MTNLALTRPRKKGIIAEIVRNRTKIIDGLAICDLSETGHRSNGYLVTALVVMRLLAVSFMDTDGNRGC